MSTKTTKAEISKSFKLQKPHRYQVFSLLQPSVMALLSNSRWHNHKERFTNNGDMAEKAKRPVSEQVTQ